MPCTEDVAIRGYTIAIILIACFAKIFPAALMARLTTKESNRFCVTVGVLMNTRGLVELIALNVALSYVCVSTLCYCIDLILAFRTFSASACSPCLC